MKEYALNPFFPEARYKSAYAVPYEKLYAAGIRGVIFDIDNTLVPPDAPADERSRELFRRLGEIGLRTCLVSNNRAPRIAPLAAALGTQFVGKALKPRKYGYLRAMEIMGTEPESTISVGDQIFTDIWGANRIGMHTSLVEPMERREEPQIVLKRILELPVLFLYALEKRRGHLPDPCWVRGGAGAGRSRDGS